MNVGHVTNARTDVCTRTERTAAPVSGCVCVCVYDDVSEFFLPWKPPSSRRNHGQVRFVFK